MTPTYNDAGQMSKQDAEYVEKAKDPARRCCGLCTQITRCPETGEHHCRVVEGDIAVLGGCKLFDLDLIKWANWPILP